MEEKRATGTCEQCGRTYDLRIPVPGSRDLAFERVEAAFGWCVGCRRFIGRACCWRPGPRCVRCAVAAEARPADAEAGGFAALASTRAVVREFEGAAADFGPVERALVVARGSDARSALGAWEDAWLAAAALRARLDSLRGAAALNLRSLPTTEAERATEIAADLTEAVRAHRARWRSIASQLAETGKRLGPPALSPAEVRTPSPPNASVRRTPPPGTVRAEPALEFRPIAVAPASTRVPIPVARSYPSVPQQARGTETVVGTRTPTQVTARAEAPARPTSQPGAPAAPPREAPTRAGAAVVTPRPQLTPDRLPRPGPLAHAAPVPHAPVEPASAVRAPKVAVRVSAAGSAPRRRHLIAFGLAAAALAVTIVALAAIVRLPPSNLERDGDSDLPAVGAGSSTAATSTAIASPSRSSGSEVPINGPIGFDHQRMGPLGPSDLPFVRVIGDPEVAAFPTPFDRSLRLMSPSSALCLPIPGDPDGGTSSISFDLYLGAAGTDGNVGLSMSPAEADQLAVALAALDGVDRERWYHASVGHEGDEWVLVLTVLDTGMRAIELPVAADPSVVRAETGEACVGWSTRATDGWIFVDNVSVDR